MRLKARRLYLNNIIMRNPFEKQNNNILIASLAIGALAAGGLTYLFVSDNGRVSRKKIKGFVKEAFKNKASEFAALKTPFSKKAVKTALDHFIK